MDNEQSPKLDPKKNANILQIELKDLYYAREAVSVLIDYVLDTSIGGFDEFCNPRGIPPYKLKEYRQYCTSAYPELYNLVSWKCAAYKSNYLKNEEKVSKIVFQKMLGDIPESDLEMAINFCNLNKMPLTVSVLITVNNALKSRKYQADQILEPEYKMQFDMDRRNYYANICKTENTLGKIEDEIRIDEEQLQLHTSDLPGARR